MKFALATIAPLVTSDATLNLSVSSNNLPILARSARNVGTKRYDQLVGQIKRYVPSDWDEKNLWGYACHCLFTGDRPLSEMGYGKPLDQIDSACRRYKQCLQCVRMSNGDECIGEMVTYNQDETDGSCSDAGGSCERGLCECDAAFAEEYSGLSNQHNMDWHYFYGDFVKEDECVRYGGGGYRDPKCCRNKEGTSNFFLYNANTEVCCDDGTTKPDGDYCDVNTTPTPIGTSPTPGPVSPTYGPAPGGY